MQTAGPQKGSCGSGLVRSPRALRDGAMCARQHCPALLLPALGTAGALLSTVLSAGNHSPVRSRAQLCAPGKPLPSRAALSHGISGPAFSQAQPGTVA